MADALNSAATAASSPWPSIKGDVCYRGPCLME